MACGMFCEAMSNYIIWLDRGGELDRDMLSCFPAD